MKVFIITLFSGFVVLIATMVTISVRQKDIHLVSKEYYKEEIAYQVTLDALNRTPAKTLVTTTQAGGVTFQINTDLQAVLAAGDTVQLNIARGEDAKRDVKQAWIVSQTLAPTSIQLGNGRWKVEARWHHAGQLYIWKQHIYV